jgi:putative Mg2+ transporter-C (MgtC) family protein
MPQHLEWSDIALRLLLTFVGGTVIGLNRGERGRPAGLRTILLVCLAASFSMLFANALLSTKGKTPDSFIQLDVMRLPLGVLSGMGFIGAGAIVRQGSLVVGLTTAATLWFVTVMGLCFGGGQLVLGISALAVGLGVLWGLKAVEIRTKRDQRGILILTVAPDGPADEDVRSVLREQDYTVDASGLVYSKEPGHWQLVYELTWRAYPREAQYPRFVDDLTHRAGVVRVDWRPETLNVQLGDAFH